jgi:hypothetical protein
VRRWSGEDRSIIGGYRVDEVPELWEWLHRRGYASAADAMVDRDAFMAGVRMQPVHLRPGLHLTKIWGYVDAEQLDESGDLAPAVRGSLNALLDALSLAPDRLCRARVVVETGVLYSDLYNETRRQLVEAKATATRPSIRMAIGQLVDYLRFIVPPPALAVLLPVRPSRDLLALLAIVRVAAVWEEGGAVADSTGGDFT